MFFKTNDGPANSALLTSGLCQPPLLDDHGVQRQLLVCSFDDLLFDCKLQKRASRQLSPGPQLKAAKQVTAKEITLQETGCYNSHLVAQTIWKVPPACHFQSRLALLEVKQVLRELFHAEAICRKSGGDKHSAKAPYGTQLQNLSESTTQQTSRQKQMHSAIRDLYFPFYIKGPLLGGEAQPPSTGSLAGGNSPPPNKFESQRPN
jgi:hypothetical protein